MENKTYSSIDLMKFIMSLCVVTIHTNFIQRYCMDYLRWMLIMVIIVCGGWFVMADMPNDYNMYGGGYFKWIHFFVFMLTGAMMGISKRCYKFHYDWKAIFKMT